MYRCLAAVVAVVALAGPAQAAEEGRLKFTKTPDEKAERAALPPGAASARVKLDCLAGVGRFESCIVLEGAEPGSAVAEAAIKLSLTQRFNPKDQSGVDAAGRRFIDYVELLAPGDKNPNWLRKPTAESLAAAWPVRAAREGKDGSATIRCNVTAEGFLDRCTVIYETPEGYGFGAAALLLKAQFAMTPRIRNGKAVEGGVVTIPITWAGLDGEGMSVGKGRVALDPNWTVVPSAAAVKAAYPAKASDVPSGQAVVRCDMSDKGQPRSCEITSEIPSGQGFGAAAKSLAPSFTILFTPEEAKLLKTLKVDIPFRFRNPTAPDDGALTDIRWTQTLSPMGAEQLFPPAARKDGLLTGLGVVSCAATAQGGLTDCRVVREDPAGKAFGAAAIEAAKLMKMNPWTKTGDAVEGRRLTVPIRFRLEETKPAPATAPAP